MKSKNIPHLRFPEFRNAPEWDEKSLNQVCEVNPSAKNLPKIFVYIDLESVESGMLLQKKMINLVDAPSRAQRLLQNGDIIFQMVRPYQKNNYFFDIQDGYKYVASTGYAQLRAYQSNRFLFHYLHTNKFVDDVLTKCTGSNYPAINSNDLSSISLNIPKPDEQQKIADCLTSLDDLIAAQSAKAEALKKQKRALMQQLFPREGESVPRLRFPEFRDAPEWEENTLGTISQILRGGSPRPIESYLTNNLDGLNWLKIGDIDKDSKYVTHTQEKVLPTALSKTREVNPGDLILSNSMSFGRPYILKIKACIHDGWIAITKIDDEFDRDYLYYFISTDASQTYFLNNAAGAAVLNLNAEIIKLLPIFAPKIDEQKKIAACFSSIDDLITAQNTKVEELKAHKKGLMQHLFPSYKGM